MAPSFGTSGLRGLISDLTDDLVQSYVAAFLTVCPHGGQLLVGRDLRASSPDIADMVIDSAVRAGLHAIDCGPVPTPALAGAAMQAGAAAIMVTGSPIPADRNGLKFYTPSGEIAKADEGRIIAAHADGQRTQGPGGRQSARQDVNDAYVCRKADGFGKPHPAILCRAGSEGRIRGRRVGVRDQRNRVEDRCRQC